MKVNPPATSAPYVNPGANAQSILPVLIQTQNKQQIYPETRSEFQARNEVYDQKLLLEKLNQKYQDIQQIASMSNSNLNRGTTSNFP